MKLLLSLAVLCLVLASADGARGEGFAVYEWSARGLALGGAAMARAPDPSAIASNPAALVYVPGTQLQAGASLIMPVGRIEFDDFGRERVADEYWVIPHGYFSHQVTENFSLGIGEYTRFALGLDYPKNWPGRYNIHNVEVQSVSVTPVAALKLTDKLSVGLGLEVMYLDAIIKKAESTKTKDHPAGYGDAWVNLNGDSFGFGGNFSLHYKLDEEWSFGAIYRSAVQHKVEGDSKVEMPAALGGGTQKQDLHANFTMPESVSAAVAWSPTPDLSFELMATWTRWSRFRYLNLHFEDGSTAYMTEHWKDAWRFGLGVEYSAADWLDLRAGYVWDQCPVTERYENYMIPTANRQIVSIGTGLKWDDWTLDLAYAFLWAHARSYDDRPQDGVFSSKTYDTRSHIVSMTLGYKF
ncbi:MAG: OmpP1/FadL family transporter [Deltaproteobacteria bacterium]|jgi:long-chain fatty acid transport protein|nr:OmpP1/FadL family transporter [Deltaproteobacteria bacterium]